MVHHFFALPFVVKTVGAIVIVSLAVYGWVKRPKTIPAKIRVLNRFRRVFPEWTLQRQARVIEHAFDSEVADAKAKKDWEALRFIEEGRRFESEEYWGALEETSSNPALH